MLWWRCCVVRDFSFKLSNVVKFKHPTDLLCPFLTTGSYVYFVFQQSCDIENINKKISLKTLAYVRIYDIRTNVQLKKMTEFMPVSNFSPGVPEN